MANLTRQQVLNIDWSAFPLLVLSDNIRSTVAARIKSITKASYNHFMWRIAPGFFCTQDWILRSVPVSGYLDAHRLKFWHNPNWTSDEKWLIINALRSDIRAPWWQRLYDPLQIIGLRLGLRWLQIPGVSRICSDHGDKLRLVDPGYNLVHPSPKEINDYCKSNPKYEVYGRYSPD
jgi:hypothetical protein